MKNHFAAHALCLFIVLTGTPRVFSADLSQPILIWPQGAPGEKGGIGEEKDMTKPTDRPTLGKAVIRIGNVSQPSITIFRPRKEIETGAAVVVCPGGGYNILAWDLEGTEVCEWLNSIGVTGVLLKYRVPKRPGLEKHVPPLQDAQRAFGLVRHRTKDFGIDTRRIGILGFSAGGHLSAVACNQFEKRTYETIDDADKESCRPDFAILVYPAYLTIKEQGDKIAPELNVTANTPPTFLAQTEDDGVRPESSLFYFLALKNAKVPAELHLYPSGGHGYGLRPSANNVSSWPKRAEEWMRAMGVLKMAK